MDNTIIINRIDSFLETLETYFDNQYQNSTPPSPPPTPPPSNTTDKKPSTAPKVEYITLINNPLPYGSFFVPSQPTQTVNIVNNIDSDDRKKKRKENKKQKENEQKKRIEETEDMIVQTLSTIGFIVTSFVGTYIVAKDKYINYKLSGVEDKMKKLKELTVSSPYQVQIRETEECFQNWRNTLLKQARPNFICKIGGITSIGLICGSFYFKKKIGILTGLFGGTMAGCYMFWKLLVTKKLRDDDSYSLLVNQLNNWRATVVYSAYPPTSPQATPSTESTPTDSEYGQFHTFPPTAPTNTDIPL